MFSQMKNYVNIHLHKKLGDNMFFSGHRKFFFLFLCFCLGFAPARAEGLANSTGKVVIAFSAERTGSFLSEPGNVPIEFLRRAGREINKTWPGDIAQIQAASVFDPAKVSEKDFLKPKPFIDLNAEQKKDAQILLDRYASEAEALLEKVRPDEQCIYMRMVAETTPFVEVLSGMMSSNKSGQKLSADQADKIQNQLLPVLQASDYIIGAAVLSNKGFEARLRICSIEKQLANPKINHSLSIAEFINPSALMVFAQTHPIEDPAKMLADMSKIPQTATVISMVASAGLDFEKDILANSARESVLYINLEPDGENGIPDIRFVAPVPDMKKLESNFDKLKTLCMQTGIFIKTTEGKPIIRLSHFMLPQYGIFAGTFDRFLILATSDGNLEDEIAFLKKAKKAEVDAESIPSGLQRYWRISFQEFNLQLQKLLQSPLLANKGVPPIPNLNFLDDLEAMKVLTLLQPDKIDFSLFLPIKEMKEK